MHKSKHCTALQILEFSLIPRFSALDCKSNINTRLLHVCHHDAAVTFNHDHKDHNFFRAEPSMLKNVSIMLCCTADRCNSVRRLKPYSSKGVQISRYLANFGDREIYLAIDTTDSGDCHADDTYSSIDISLYTTYTYAICKLYCVPLPGPWQLHSQQRMLASYFRQYVHLFEMHCHLS